MGRRIILISIIGLFMGKMLWAQQDVSFSQYMFDKMLINPAYAGSSKWIVGSVKNRLMISQIEGAPMTNMFTFQAPVQQKNIGLGLKVIQDKIAITNRYMLAGDFSYHIGFGNGNLSFGIEGGIVNNNYNYDDLVRTTLDDPALPAGKQSVIIPDVSAGIFYRNRVFYLGGALYHLLDKKKEVPDYAGNRFYSQDKNAYLTGGYMYEIDRDMFIEPGFLLKYVAGAPIQADINVSFIMVDKFSAGLSYRTGDAVLALFKLDITRNIKIMYSYDYVLSAMSEYSKGNSEFGISYGIELLPPPSKKVIHPRYYF